MHIPTRVMEANTMSMDLLTYRSKNCGSHFSNILDNRNKTKINQISTEEKSRYDRKEIHTFFQRPRGAGRVGIASDADEILK